MSAAPALPRRGPGRGQRRLSRGWWLAVAVAASASCRTEIRPEERAGTRVWAPPPADGGCAVTVYTTAAEVPPGARNLGWVKVPFTDTDEATLQALEAAICARGGSLASQVRWSRKPGTGLLVPPVAVEANAWTVR